MSASDLLTQGRPILQPACKDDLSTRCDCFDRLPQPVMPRIAAHSRMPAGDNVDGRNLYVGFEYLQVRAPLAQQPLRDKSKKILALQKLK